MVLVILDYIIRALLQLVGLGIDALDWAVNNPVYSIAIIGIFLYLDYSGIYTFTQLYQDTLLAVWTVLKQIATTLYDVLVKLLSNLIDNMIQDALP